ncbi:MAG: DUF1924 domain-containing protein [Rhodobacter sp.]|nr:DUF1924 domain-containing protein [Rhodobacter sp.]
MKRKPILPLVLGLICTGTLAAWAASGPRQEILSHYANQAGVALSAERGRAFFLASQTGGNPDTPSCSSCHTANPKNAGRTRVGKVIEPMAVSRTPARFTDAAKVEKWFGRNCNTVLGRECSSQEKGDILAYFSSL